MYGSGSINFCCLTEKSRLENYVVVTVLPYSEKSKIRSHEGEATLEVLLRRKPLRSTVMDPPSPDTSVVKDMRSLLEF